MCPLLRASWAGVSNLMERGKCGTPRLNKNFTTSKLPLLAASCKGTRPVSLFRASMFAFASTSI